MIFAYTQMPHGAASRPLLDVEVTGAGFALKGLVDTGAVNTLLGSWVADEVGIDLTGVPIRALAVGGMGYDTRFVTVSLTAAGHTWDAEVGFCENWQPGWGLLGHEGFLRFFTLTIRAVDFEFELEPITA